MAAITSFLVTPALIPLIPPLAVDSNFAPSGNSGDLPAGDDQS